MTHIIGACGKEWYSPPKVGGRRKQQHITTTITSQRSLEDARMHYSLAVMFHAFPVVKRRENTAVITDTAHIIEICGKEWHSPAKVGGKRKQQHT